MDVVGHYYEGVKVKLALVAIAEEGGDEEFGVLGALEVTFALECEYGDGIGALLLADGGHGRKAYPRG